MDGSGGGLCIRNKIQICFACFSGGNVVRRNHSYFSLPGSLGILKGVYIMSIVKVKIKGKCVFIFRYIKLIIKDLGVR